MIVTGECVERLRELAAGSVDAVVTDPPYGLEFMGKDWDKLSGQPGYVERGRITDRPDAQVPYGRGGGVNSYQAGRPMQAWHEAWALEALRVLKPGGHLLAFGGSRTYHRLACAIEDAGFEIRDTIMWLYGQGFPKSLDVGGGWGTALKPAHEPVVVARKPFVGTVAANVLARGTGALNVEGCRLAFASASDEAEAKAKNRHGDFGTEHGGNAVYGDYTRDELRENYDPEGRWPPNVALDQEAAEMLDAQTGELAPGNHPARRRGIGYTENGASNSGTVGERRATEGGGASRFFYCAKASRAERNAGLEQSSTPLLAKGATMQQAEDADWSTRNGNHHPTVKPVELMRWLVRLVTPAGGLVLDPFTGSGTTGVACVLEGFEFVGVERDPDYVAIAEARIAWWAAQPAGLSIEQALAGEGERQKVAGRGQESLFG